MTTQELSRLDISRNVARPPRGASAAFVRGWRDREAGVVANPFSGSPSNQPPEFMEWERGAEARGDLGFDYSHRIGSGTRLGPFQF